MFAKFRQWLHDLLDGQAEWVATETARRNANPWDV